MCFTNRDMEKKGGISKTLLHCTVFVELMTVVYCSIFAFCMYRTLLQSAIFIRSMIPFINGIYWNKKELLCLSPLLAVRIK